ncbi:MAG: hypothetical protein AB8G22_18810 [Saprospiraceae bacterium]
MKKLFFLFITLLSFQFVNAQDSSDEMMDSTELAQLPIAPADLAEIKKLEDTLAYLSYKIVNDSLDNNRFASVHKFIPTLVKTLKHKNSFHYPFQRLKTVSIQYPQDSTFRIFTWQVYVEQGIYHYYGAIQMKGEDLKLFPLRDRSEQIEDIEHQTLTADNWYGSLYYNIKQFETRYGTHYALFGFDRVDFFNKSKMIDVLHFRDGQPQFGAPVFISKNPQKPFTKSRIILQYSAASSIRCNYDEFMEMIVFDHLIEVSQGVPGQGGKYVTDGSYEGFKYDNGVWVHLPKMFTTVSDEAPRETPVLDQRKKKDIFGNR